MILNSLPFIEMNRDHFVVFEISPKYCISDSFVDYEGYSISSKGFLPTLVFCLFDNSHFDRCEMIHCYGLDLHFPDDQ